MNARRWSQRLVRLARLALAVSSLAWGVSVVVTVTWKWDFRSSLLSDYVGDPRVTGRHVTASFALGDGVLRAAMCDGDVDTPTSELGWRLEPSRRRPGRWCPRWERFQDAKGRQYRSIELPLWMVTALPAGVLLATPLVRRALRRGNNHSMTCDYDLTGNSSGVCPECGTPIGSPSR